VSQNGERIKSSNSNDIQATEDTETTEKRLAINAERSMMRGDLSFIIPLSLLVLASVVSVTPVATFSNRIQFYPEG
jgi:hypothetical protein